MSTSTNVIRRIEIRASAPGADDATRSIQGLSKAQQNAGEIAGAYDKLMQQLSDTLAGQAALYQQGQADLARAAAANENYANSHSHIGTAIRVGAKAAIEYTASTLATAGAVGAAVLALGNLLGVLGPIYLAYKLVKEAIDLVSEAWELGGKKLDEYREIAERAAKVDLSTSYFQKLIAGAEAAKVPLDALTAAFNTLQKQSADQLGGSALQNRLAASVKAGNFAGNTGVAEYAQANTTQQRYEAIVSLIHQAMEAGQRLAALDIAGTAFGPEAVENLRKDSEYFDKLNAAAAKIAEKQIVSPEDVGRALDLKNRYEAAVAILEQRWHPVQDLLTQAGMEFRANWVATVETIASGVDWATKLVAKLGDVPSWFQKKLNEGGQWVVDVTTTPQSRAAAEQSYGITSNPADMAASTDAYADAVKRLRAGLQDQAEQQRKVSEANTIAQKTLGDTSHAIDGNKKSASEAKDALDRALESIEKYIQITTAAAGTVDASVYEQQKAKVIAELTAAAMRDGKTDLAQYADEWNAIGDRAGTAARNLSLARVASQIKFGQQTSMLAPEDVAIAQQLKGLYPDVATALGSVEAAGLRTNAALTSISSSMSSTLTTGFADVLDGTKSVSQGFSDMSKSIIRSIEEAVIKAQIVAPLMRALQSSFGGFLGTGSAAAAGGTGFSLTGTGGLFAEGGYTGPGTKYQPAGIVHAGEYVFSQASVGRIGLGNLDRLHRGYADGGPVLPVTNYSNDNRSGGSVTVNVHNAPAGTTATAQAKSDGNGGFNIDVMLDAANAKNLANPGSATSRVLAQRGKLASR